jgi:AcrR family transcriptional regulator
MPRAARLNRELIVETALRVVDERGVDGLTMRALARALGADPMAVYRHVRDKDALLGLLCDAVVADLDPLDPAGPWRPQIERQARQLRAALTARPSLAAVLAGAPVTPAALAVTQRAVELLTRNGLPVATASGGFATVFSYVLGFAVVEAALPDASAEDRSELRAGALHHLGDPEADPPHLDLALALLDSPGDFAFGLELILDGIERRGAPAGDAPQPAQP